MNWSIGLRTQSAVLTGGGVGRRGATYAQCSGVAAAAVCVLVASGGGPASPGHSAPWAIQVRSSAI